MVKKATSKVVATRTVKKAAKKVIKTVAASGRANYKAEVEKLTEKLKDAQKTIRLLRKELRDLRNSPTGTVPFSDPFDEDDVS